MKYNVRSSESGRMDAQQIMFAGAVLLVFIIIPMMCTGGGGSGTHVSVKNSVHSSTALHIEVCRRVSKSLL